jgi:hypothetical protein
MEDTWQVRLLIDTSGSMGGVQDNGKRIFDTVIQSAVDTVMTEVWQAARSEQKPFCVHVDTFDHSYSANTVPSYTVTPRDNTEENMATQHASLVDSLAETKCAGMTLLYDSTWRAMQALLASKSARCLLVLVTDGADTCSTSHKWTDVQEIIAANRALKLCPIMCNDISEVERRRVTAVTGVHLRPPPLFQRTSSSSVAHSMRCASDVVRVALTGVEEAPEAGDVEFRAEELSLAAHGAVLGMPSFSFPAVPSAELSLAPRLSRRAPALRRTASIFEPAPCAVPPPKLVVPAPRSHAEEHGYVNVPLSPPLDLQASDYI